MIGGGRLAQLTALIRQSKEYQFYSWPEWDVAGLDTLKLNNYERQRCKAKGRHSRAVIVHHVKPLKDRPGGQPAKTRQTPGKTGHLPNDGA